MCRIFSGLLALAVCCFAFASAAQADNSRPPQESPPQRPTQPQPPQPKKEPSIHGTWLGYLNIAGTKVKVTSTLREDGTYKSVMENGDYVAVEKGKYTYSDGVLNTEPEGGFAGTFTVTFEDKDTIKVKGGGISITYKRQ